MEGSILRFALPSGTERPCRAPAGALERALAAGEAVLDDAIVVEHHVDDLVGVGLRVSVMLAV